MENTATLSPAQLLRAAAELFPSPVYEWKYQGGGRWEEYEVENPTRTALLRRAAELES